MNRPDELGAVARAIIDANRYTTLGTADDTKLDHGIEVFSRRSQDHGAPAWTTEDVVAPAPLRLYLAVATEHWILDPDHRPDRRTPVTV